MMGMIHSKVTINLPFCCSVLCFLLHKFSANASHILRSHVKIKLNLKPIRVLGDLQTVRLQQPAATLKVPRILVFITSCHLLTTDNYLIVYYYSIYFQIFSSQFFPCNCYVSRPLYSVYCLCVNVYYCHRVSTQLQLNNNNNNNNNIIYFCCLFLWLCSPARAIAFS
jgi:hypothetical protein